MQKTITYADITITVRTATVLDGMKRGQLLSQAFEQPRDDDTLQTVAVVLYPVCVSCSDWMGTLEEFSALPESLVNQWLAAAYELNPHWIPEPITPGEQEKKDSV